MGKKKNNAARQASSKIVVVRPVNVETFRYACAVFTFTGMGKIASDNPEDRPIRLGLDDDRERVLRMTDVPINRAMMKMMDELREAGVCDEDRMAIGMRVISMDQIVADNSGRLSSFIQNRDEGVSIDECLLDAAATARFSFSSSQRKGEQGGYDIADLAAKAQALKARTEAALQLM